MCFYFFLSSILHFLSEIDQGHHGVLDPGRVVCHATGAQDLIQEIAIKRNKHKHIDTYTHTHPQNTHTHIYMIQHNQIIK